ncbi:MAG: hypothetical protein ABSF40_10735 [Candidatus Acidiferrales bacterium]|jgi:hypothetical protein
MKIKLWWIIAAISLVTIAGYVIPNLKYWFPSTHAASEPAREEQATPDATVNTMFQMTDQGGASDNPKEVLDDRLDYGHMLQGKDAMTPEEQKFASLFLDNQRSASIYVAMRSALAKSASITASNVTGDSAVVSVALQIFPDKGSDWVNDTCTVELKKRGANWYVDELKTPRLPDGIYHAFKQRLG